MTSLTITLRRLLTISALTLAWCGLWQSLSIANVLSGLAVSAAVTLSGIGTPGRGGVRILPLLHLLWLVFVDLVSSTTEVAYEILTPTDYTNEAIVAVALPPEARDHMLLLSIAITLTPGTAVVDVEPDTGTLYLHLLHSERTEDTIAHAHELSALACKALPSKRADLTKAKST